MGNAMGKQQSEQGLGLHKFRLLRVIGRGSFGKVRIVEHRETGKAYALKYINKATCINMKSHHNTIRERDMLEEIDHPFIVNLRFSFQDEFTMYVVMDLMIGGDLRFHMLRRRFVEGVVKFWMAELVCAINHLHRNHHIVHRDIKPDNILIDDRGHAALTDFNIATRIKGTVPHYSVAGTANYMAPEVVGGTGYTYSVDWWSLGVVMYECIYGKRPFRHKKSNEELKLALLYEEIQFPIVADVQISYDCISAMRGFLNKEPNERLGCGPGGFEAIKNHPFFSSINWTLLEAKQLDPPFAPSNSQSNFDISIDLEEMLLEPEPLDPRKRSAMKKHKTPPEHSTPEYFDIEENFSAFDYIEYDRFKSYIVAHGSIDTFAVDAARAMASVNQRTSASTENGSAPPPLSQLKLNGRSIINLDPRAATPTPTASISGTRTRSRNSTVTQMAPPNHSRCASRDVNNAQQPQLSPSAMQSRYTTQSNSSTSILTTITSLPTANQQTTHSPTSAALLTAMTTTNAPGTLEPPSSVPIDILTWNQLLPEQRLLAHRYCVKMAHDHRRLVTISERKARGIAGSQLTMSPMLRTAVNTTVPGHRYTPSGSVLLSQNASKSRVPMFSQSIQPTVNETEYSCRSEVVADTPTISDTPNVLNRAAVPDKVVVTDTMAAADTVSLAEPSVRTIAKAAETSGVLLTSNEKRKSLMKRQHSVDNLSLAKSGLPRKNGGKAGPQRIIIKYAQQGQQQQYQELDMCFSSSSITSMQFPPLPEMMKTSNSTINCSTSHAAYASPVDQSELYLYQPLPPPPLMSPPPMPAMPLPDTPLTSSALVLPMVSMLSDSSYKLHMPAHMLDIRTAPATAPISSSSSSSPYNLI
ncbi:kinase-like domain-containing protein [Kickxella alabastrina]|uniref:kinase-like domain-containing protein n=1 Tax=Kickxella alabastrina TaxID=61397 RepID=UPI00221FCBE8|nr:kinase-like domain-containing protein [Kickxella alabastrina]KAI7827197.1 kinase-like domain-containing protein [Kickxella alabastrina]